MLEMAIVDDADKNVSDAEVVYVSTDEGLFTFPSEPQRGEEVSIERGPRSRTIKLSSSADFTTSGRLVANSLFSPTSLLSFPTSLMRVLTQDLRASGLEGFRT